MALEIKIDRNEQSTVLTYHPLSLLKEACTL